MSDTVGDADGRDDQDQPGAGADALAAVVAERLGFDRDTALTLGHAVAGLSAYAKGVSLGIIEPSPELVRERGQRLGEGEQTPDGLRAVSKGNPGNPGNPTQVEKYLASKFGPDLEATRAAMEALAANIEPTELQPCGFRLYERFRPEVPAGESGWGAKGELNLGKVRAAAS